MPSTDPRAAESRLERSVAAALLTISAACAERKTASVHAARRELGSVYGQTRLRRRLEREAAPA